MRPSLHTLLAHAALAGLCLGFDYKQLSGEPAEFAQHLVPAPSASATYTDHTTEAFSFSAAGDWTSTLTVDSKTGFLFALFTEDVKNLKVTLTDPTGKSIDLDSRRSTVSVPISDSAESAAAGVQWAFENPTTGQYKLTVSAVSMASILALRTKKAGRNITGVGTADGLLIIWNDSKDRLLTHTTTMHTVQGQPIGLSARMFDEEATPFAEFLRTKVKPSALTDVVSTATLEVVSPSGAKSSIPMNDEGFNGDDVPGDGDYVGTLVAREPGEYVLKAAFSGKNADGAFSRTSEHTIVVLEQTARFANSNAISFTDAKTQRLHLHVLLDVAPAQTAILKTYAEVWGKGPDGSDVAVTFAENLSPVKRFLSPVGWLHYVELEVDLRWLAKVGVTKGLSLRNVHIQDINKLVTLDMRQSLSVVHVLGGAKAVAAVAHDSSKAQLASPAAAAELASMVEAILSSGYRGEITKVMREGIPPVRAPRNVSSTTPNLVIVHGFCADRNPFEVQSDDWTNVAYYSAKREGDPLGSEHNDFAENVLRFINAQDDGKGLDSFGMVGQSQGGMVILHILNYYHTGLDNAKGGKQLQSVATPYLGNSALTSLGGIASIIAADCEPPQGLSREGAVAWIAGITQSNVDLTNIYATKYDKGGLFGGGYCNQLMNVFLSTPNDGVCEVAYSAPESGGNVNPVKAGFCHTEGMEWPPSFWDSERNKQMNADAAR